MTQWVLILGMLIGSPCFASVNPDGSAWIPSLEGDFGDSPGRDVQQATLNYYSAQPPFSENVNVSQDDALQYQFGLKLPLSDALTLRAAYLASGVTGDFIFSSGNITLWTGTEVQANTNVVGGLTLYTQAFAAQQEMLWGINSNPDGRFWFPSFTALLNYDTQTIQEPEQLLFNGTKGTYNFGEYYRQGEVEGTLPLPWGFTMTGDYGRDLWFQYVDDSYPRHSYSDGGVQDWWGFGAHTWFGADKSDRTRGWNPDGEVGSAKVGITYGEDWSNDQRENHAYAVHLTYILSSAVSLLCDLTAGMNDSDPYANATGLNVTNQMQNPYYTIASLGVRVYFPGTIPKRPWSVQDKPAEKTDAAQTDPSRMQLQWNDPTHP